MQRKSVAAVVVAYNRRELLTETLTALLAQERVPDRIVVVDNGSTDGTSQLVSERFPAVELTTLPRNTGGAGGFAVGVERALLAGQGTDWVWLMDDDTVPEPGALGALLDAADRLAEPELLASRVVWTDGREHPMNMPRLRPFAAAADRGNAERVGAYPVRSASFVSTLVRASAVRRAGLPIADYFLWNDDFEFTTRLLRHGRGYLVRGSTVTHKTKVFGGTDADPGPRFYLEVRNKVWLLGRGRSLGPLERLLYAGSTLRRWARTIARSRRRRVLADGLVRGLRDGLARGPRHNADVLADLPAPLVVGQRSLGGRP